MRNPNEIINDFGPETESLLNRILAAGFEIIRTDDRSDEDTSRPFTSIESAVEHLTSVDESNVIVEDINGNRYNLFLVYGNSPGELVCDYSYPRSGDLLEPIVQSHSAEWELKGQPKTTVGLQYPNLYYQIT